MTASDPEPRRPQLLRRLPPNVWAIAILAVIGIAVYLVVDHWPHVLAALPYVLILAIVGMHLFGHGGHGGHGGGTATGSHAGHGGESTRGSEWGD